MSVYIDYLIDRLEEDGGPTSKGGIIDANKYTTSVGAMKNLMNDKNAKERFEAISSVSVATSVPVIAVVAWVMDIYGNNEELRDLLGRLMKFYVIDSVLIKDLVIT